MVVTARRTKGRLPRDPLEDPSNATTTTLRTREPALESTRKQQSNPMEAMAATGGPNQQRRLERPQSNDKDEISDARRMVLPPAAPPVTFAYHRK